MPGYPFERTPIAWLRWAVSGRESRHGAPYEPGRAADAGRREVAEPAAAAAPPLPRPAPAAPVRRKVDREYVELWEQALAAIALRVREASFEGWLKTARLVEIEPDGTAVIESQVELGPVWMEENYSRMLLEVIGGLREGVGE